MNAVDITAAPERPSIRKRLKARFIERLPHIRRTLPRDLLILVVIAILAQHFKLAWVMTDSIKTSVALVIMDARPARGDVAVFTYSGKTVPRYYDESTFALRRWLGMKGSLEGPRAGEAFSKYVAGLPGDKVEVVGRDVFIVTADGVRRAVGTCKTTTRHGYPLECTKSQVIPPGFLYMWGPHADALDSRYTLMSLVPGKSVVAKAVPLW